MPSSGPDKSLTLRRCSSGDYAVFMLGPEGLVTSWNQEAKKITGHATEDIIGRPYSIFYPPEDAASDKPAVLLHRATKQGHVVDEGWRQRSDGSRFWCNTVLTVVRDAEGVVTGFVKVVHDLSEIIQTESSLRLSEERFARAFIDAATGMALVSLNGDFLKVNKALCRLLGYSEEELTRLTFQAVTHPDDLDSDLGHVNSILSGKSDHYRLEKRYIHREGRVVWGNLTVSVVRKTDGKASYFISQVQDITEAKAVAAALHAETNLFRTILDNTPDLIFVRDRESRHVLNNRANLRALRANTLEDTLGKSDFDFFPPEMAEAFYKDDQQVMRSGVPLVNREEMIYGPNGEIRWQLTTKTPLRDAQGQVIGLVGIGRDITEQKQAREKIRSQAAMLDQAHDAIILYDRDNRVTYWNAGAERILGLKSQEALGRRVDEIYSAEDLPAVQEAMEITFKTGMWRGELQLHNREGKMITLDSRRTLIRDEAGNPVAQMSIDADITDKTQLEAQFLRAQRMESVGILAGGIAHDLNNVLAPILMSIALLKLKMPDNEKVQKQLDQLAAYAQRGANLVKQVLTFGRGAENQRVLMQPKHIGREIEQIVSDTFPKNIEFDFTFSAELWPITGDPTQVHQTLLNLCVNARDAMPTGGKLSLRMENQTVDSTYAGMQQLSSPGPYVAISVSDTGTGIPLAIRERIFEPFFTTKDIGKGTGLGLSTTLAIVKSHGGFIDLRSEEGRGTTFLLYFPASSAPVSVDAPGAAKRGLPLGDNELVLIVDDEVLIREIARNTLERFGYRVLLAQNGTEAVALYALHRTDIAVVVTDMAMPVMDGPATILALRTINPDVKIVGSSGQGTSSVMKTGKSGSAGLSYFIPKPYTAETLLHTLAKILNKGSNPPMSDRPA
jgi:PAS domain S-box-containing protein